MDNDKTLLEVKNLRTYFDTKYGTLPAVNDVSFAIKSGEVLGIVGESGCGKSVMSMSILRIIEKYGGYILKDSSIKLNGKELLDMTDKELLELRGKEMSMIFQDPMTSLNPVFTIEYQMVEMIRRHMKLNKKEALKLAVEWLGKVGIPDPEKRIKNYPYQMSGGMRQRVVIAMALSCNPKLLIADEPTTALDVTIQAQIIELFLELRDKVNASIILITHDLGVVADLADNILIMYAGHVLEYGTKRQIFENPCHPYTQGLLASVPSLDKNTERLFSIDGSVPNLLQEIPGCIFSDRCKLCMKKCKMEMPRQTCLADGRTVSCWLYENKEEETAHA